MSIERQEFIKRNRDEIVEQIFENHLDEIVTEIVNAKDITSVDMSGIIDDIREGWDPN